MITPGSRVGCPEADIADGSKEPAHAYGNIGRE